MRFLIMVTIHRTEVLVNEMMSQSTSRVSRLVPALARYMTLLVGTALFTPMWLHAQNVIYVNQVATAPGTGTSWENAFPSLQDALDAWTDDDDIWVARGTYSPDDGASVLEFDRMATFTLLPGMRLYGGFSGTELSVTDRDLSLNETVLSGDLLENDSGEEFEDNLTRSDNSENVVSVSTVSEGVSVILDGFTVSHGQSGNIGGGVFVGEKAYVEIINGRFVANFALFCGGALSSLGYIKIQDSIFRGNQAGSNGSSCLGGSGGALYQSWRTSEQMDVPKSLLYNVTFESNEADKCGGAVAVGYGGMDVIRSTFEGNSAGWGGSICVNGNDDNTPMVLMNSTLIGNTATEDGGGLLFASAGVVDIINSVISGNRVLGLDGFGRGGAVFAQRAAVIRVRNSTIGTNMAPVDWAFYVERSDLTIQNSIVWRVREDLSNWLGTSQSPSVSVHSSRVPSDSSPTVAMVEVIHDDPIFVDADGPDNSLGTFDDNYRLASNSPAVDIGNILLLPSDLYDLDGDGDVVELLPVDHDGNMRVFQTDGFLDLGAFEFGSTPVNHYQYPLTIDRRNECAFVELFPNPTSGLLHINLSYEERGHKQKVSIFDTLGRVIDERLLEPSSSILIDVTGYAVGVYILRITHGHSESTCTKSVLVLD